MSTTYIRKTGAFVATNAALEINGDLVGFRPAYVKIINETNGATLEWIDAQGDGYGLVNDGAGTQTVLTTGGVSQLATGFKLDSAIANINDTTTETLVFFASG
jgi:hypothetical protein